VEIAKFVLAAIGTFLSVLGFSFAVFQYWKKKQEEKFVLLKKSIEAEVQNETAARSNALNRLDKRIEFLEQRVLQSFENRLSVIEGELKGIKPILQSIQNWFINNNTGRG
jgi:archaellum component FlaC